MATYSPSELDGNGILLKENLTASTTYTFTITDKTNLSGSAYLFLETTPHLSGSEVTASFQEAVVDQKTNTTGEIIEDFKMGIVILKEGASTFDFTPSKIIDSTKVRIKATGYIGCEIN